MESYIKPNSDILSESKDQFSSFFHLIIDDRKNLYRELRRRILLLKAIIDEKMVNKYTYLCFPVGPKHAHFSKRDCLSWALFLFAT